MCLQKFATRLLLGVGQAQRVGDGDGDGDGDGPPVDPVCPVGECS